MKDERKFILKNVKYVIKRWDAPRLNWIKILRNDAKGMKIISDNILLKYE